MTGMRPAAYFRLLNHGDMFLLAQGDRFSRGSHGDNSAGPGIHMIFHQRCQTDPIDVARRQHGGNERNNTTA